MNKNKLSITVVLATILYVTTTLYFNRIEIIEHSRVSKYNVLNSLKGISLSKVLTLLNIGNSGDKNSKDLAAFSTKDIIKYTLSEADKEKILEAAKPLSPIDRAKVSDYIDSSYKESILKAFTLIKIRLGNEQFDKIKEILKTVEAQK
jgi:hypothetical protein